MTNEQFALWITSTKDYNPSDTKSIADDYYEWLEDKRKKPSLPSVGVTVTPMPDLTKPPTLYDGRTGKPVNK
jgi:hypothetical protein